MAFTTWQALKTQILDGLADGTVLKRSYSMADRSLVLRDMKEVITLLKYCDEQIANPSASTGKRQIKGGTPC